MLQNKDRIKQIDAAQAVESRLITNQHVFYVINALPGKTSSCEVQVWLRDVKCDHPPETTCKGVRDPSNAATIKACKISLVRFLDRHRSSTKTDQHGSVLP